MNISEMLERHFNAVHQVLQTRRYRCLSIIVLVSSVIAAIHVFEPEFWQMRRMRQQIDELNPQWIAFKGTHSGFEAVELFPEYDMAHGVTFTAKGTVPWTADVKQLTEFMRSTTFPFSINVLQLARDFSNAHPAFLEKTSVVTMDGRRVEILVPRKP